MMRDIDYAAIAVRKQIEEKFGQKHDLEQLEVHAQETTILVEQGSSRVSGTRDDLLAELRKAASLDDFFEAAGIRHYLPR